MTAESDEEVTIGGGVPRRRFLILAGSVVAFAGLSACNPAAVAPLLTGQPSKPTSPPKPPAAGPLERSSWAPLVGKVAVLDGPAGIAHAKVVEVTGAAGTTGADQEHQFSVLLRATGGAAAPSAVHRVSVAGAAPTELFVSPVDRGTRNRWYQIVVNNPS